MNADNGLNNAGHMVFPKKCDITAGNTQDVNDRLLTGGSISGNCMDAIIKNSSAQGTLLTIGLNDYGVFVGKSYQYDFFLQRCVTCADAFLICSLGDITPPDCRQGIFEFCFMLCLH